MAVAFVDGKFARSVETSAVFRGEQRDVYRHTVADHKVFAFEDYGRDFAVGESVKFDCVVEGRDADDDGGFGVGAV